MARSAALIAVAALAAATAASAQPKLQRFTGKPIVEAGCPAGAVTVIEAPDGSAFTVLFDGFGVSRTASDAPSSERRSCTVAIPLAAPEGYSLGVQKVDYRGFVLLDQGQAASLAVDYGVGGRREFGRKLQRAVRGPIERDFAITDTIGAGGLRRAGCGGGGAMNLTAVMQLQAAAGSGDAQVTLDSIDGARGVTFHTNLRPCAGPHGMRPKQGNGNPDRSVGRERGAGWRGG